jgi:hypothetical protein
MTINNSIHSPYYSQINNRRVPFGSCNVTMACQCIDCMGWPFPDRRADEDPQDIQPEDRLLGFILRDPECTSLWRQLEPSGLALPNERAEVLTLGINRWVNIPDLVVFHDAEKADGKCAAEILTWLRLGNVAGFSGSFPRTHGHVVACIGAEWDEGPQWQDGLIKNWIIDDPYGNYHTGYADHHGNDIVFPFQDFMDIIKPAGSLRKRVFFFRKNT